MSTIRGDGFCRLDGRGVVAGRLDGRGVVAGRLDGRGVVAGEVNIRFGNFSGLSTSPVDLRRRENDVDASLSVSWLRLLYFASFSLAVA